MHRCQHLCNVLIHPQSTVSSKIDQDFDLYLFLQCTAAVCTSCTMMFVQRPYQMQMTRQVWRRQRPAAGCCHCCTQFHCCTAHVVDSRSVQGRSCILPRLATWPRTCLGSKSSTFPLASFWTRPLCLSVVLGTSDYDLVAQKIAGSQFQPDNQCPWTMACKVAYCSSAKFLKYFFLPPHKVHSLLHPTELRNSVPVNKCVQQLLQRPHHQQEPTMHLQALDRAATRLSTKPGAQSHSATISTLSVQQLLFYSYYVFRPHHDKTMFKQRRCKTPNLPSIWLHCQLSPWQEFWQHRATKQHQVPFFKTAATSPQEMFLCVLPTPFCITSPTMVS